MMCTFRTPPAKALNAQSTFGNHPALDDALVLERVDLRGAQRARHVTVLAAHTFDVGEQHELASRKRLGDLAGDRVSIDVERPALRIDRHRRNDRNEAIVDESAHDVRVDLRHRPDATRVDPLAALGFHLVDLLGAKEGVVFACESDRPTSMSRNERDDLRIELATEDHLDDFHGVLVGHTESFEALRDHAQ